MPLNTEYEGQCHCGAVRWMLLSQPITEALKCTCSICRRRNSPMSKEYYGPDRFTLLSGEDALVLYKWGDGDVNHRFCGTCGIYPFHDTVQKPGYYRINLGCMPAVDLTALEITLFDGANLL